MVKVILLENSPLICQEKIANTLVCCAVCGFSEESEMIGIDVAGLPVSSDEILWVECSKCEQWYHQLCVEVEPEELSEEIDWICGKC